ncbi:adult cuticle protein 1-like [Eupeodes corollae]|uniref:adult cuticle protein 1-like n=1 Tax=Eupeodes corollae TaxID=290404 RepID=UPI00248FE461|nr:adult cuticle protein 1-like [Eupeodes corollae]
MKFAIVAVVVFALAITSAQASVVPLILGAPAPISYTAVHGPTLTIAGLPSVAVHSPAAVAVHAAPVVVPAPVVVAAEGTYVAKTRGAVHVAPLPGHLNSAASVNLEPAPGTI